MSNAQLDDALSELSNLRRAMQVGIQQKILTSAIRIINRHNLVEEFTNELLKPDMREAIAADFGL